MRGYVFNNIKTPSLNYLTNVFNKLAENYTSDLTFSFGWFNRKIKDFPKREEFEKKRLEMLLTHRKMLSEREKSELLDRMIQNANLVYEHAKDYLKEKTFEKREILMRELSEMGFQ